MARMISPSYLHASPGTRILFLLLLWFAGLLISGLLLTLVSFIPALSGNARASIYTGTVIQSVVAFMLPALFDARLGGGNVWTNLKLMSDRLMGQKIAFGISAFILSYGVVSFLNQWNQSIALPERFQSVEEWMRALEDSAMEVTHLLLSGGTTLHLLLNVLIVAGLAAMAEEIFFRGALQQLLAKKFRNGHAAVWGAALIFSVIHFQFYGFFPRLVLGALLGYLFLYTRNLWVPILVHFINNATVILLHHFWSDSEWMLSLEETEITVPFATVALLSVAFTFLLFRNYRKRNIRHNVDHHRPSV